MFSLEKYWQNNFSKAINRNYIGIPKTILIGKNTRIIHSSGLLDRNDIIVQTNNNAERNIFK